LLEEIWFKYHDGISICFGQQQFLHLSFKVPSYQTWLIVKTIINTLFPILKQCVLNQNQGYWLLFDAFVYTFSLFNMMKGETNKIEALNCPLILGNFNSKL
jgi:hypothetical protein